MSSFWDKLKEQEVVDPRLLIAFPVLLVLGGVVWFVFMRDGGTSDRDVPGITPLTYICHYDQATREVGGEKLWEMEADGDAFINRGGAIPTRVRCPECKRMSCFLPDQQTGEPIAVDDSWDLGENAQPEAANRGGAARGGR